MVCQAKKLYENAFILTKVTLWLKRTKFVTEIDPVCVQNAELNFTMLDFSLFCEVFDVLQQK